MIQDAISISTGWRLGLKPNDKGNPATTILNVVHALRTAPEWEGVLAFDESAYHVMAKKAPPWPQKRNRQFPSRWSDVDDIKASLWMHKEHLAVSKNIVGQAVQAVADDWPYHPVREHLDSLEWDFTARLDTFLAVYFGAADDEYTRTVGRKFLIGAVARVYEPGCKNDCCLVLEGDQGLRKSTALRTLAGCDQWFTDDMPDFHSKDAKYHTRGYWIVELPELDTLLRSDPSASKAFLSRQRDDVRLPYHEYTSSLPRECVFVGTINDSQYLKDATGARRFWPVRCEAINIPELRRDRDQIVAEAVHEYMIWKAEASTDDAPWWFEDEGLVVEEQAKRFETGAIEDEIEAFLNERLERKSDPTVSQIEIQRDCLKLRERDWVRMQKPISQTLTRLKWERFRRRLNGRLEWRYRPRS